MKSKALIITTGLVLVLGASLLYLKFGRKEKETGAYFPQDLKQFCINDTCLNKSGNNWRVKTETEAPADGDSTEIFANALKKIKLNEVISTNKDKFKQLGFEDNSKLTITSGDKKLEVGLVNDTYDGTFVKEAGGSAVYLIGTVIDKNNILTPGYWNQKKVTNWPRYQVTSIIVTHNEKSKELTRKDDKWEDETLVNTLCALSAGKYLPGFDSSNSDTFKFKAKDDSGKEYQLLAGAKTEDRKKIYWARENSGDIFEISKTDYDLLTGIRI